MATPKDPKQKPSASEFGQLRAKLAQLGVSQAQITAAIGGSVSNRDRQQIANVLINWLKTL